LIRQARHLNSSSASPEAAPEGTAGHPAFFRTRVFVSQGARQTRKCHPDRSDPAFFPHAVFACRVAKWRGRGVISPPPQSIASSTNRWRAAPPKKHGLLSFPPARGIVIDSTSSRGAPVSCPICEKRKGARFCPAKGEKICAICCGTEREVTIDCPVHCSY